MDALLNYIPLLDAYTHQLTGPCLCGPTQATPTSRIHQPLLPEADSTANTKRPPYWLEINPAGTAHLFTTTAGAQRIHPEALAEFLIWLEPIITRRLPPF